MKLPKWALPTAIMALVMLGLYCLFSSQEAMATIVICSLIACLIVLSEWLHRRDGGKA